MDPSAEPAPHLLQTLCEYGACDISDALSRLNVPGAGFLPDLSLYSASPILLPGADSPPRCVAPASTVLFVSKNIDSGRANPPGNIPTGRHWADVAVPGTIVVGSQPEGQKNAVLGGILAARMRKLNVLGLVVYGRIRDVQELRETGLTIWAKGTSTVGAGAETKAHAVNIPITLAGVTINPGDFVFCDPASGVVVIPQSKLPEVLELLPRLVAADDHVKADVLDGIPVREAFKKHRSGLL